MRLGLSIFVFFMFTLSALAEEKPVRVGWIGALTGPVARYGAGKAAILAQEEINANGGIKGRPLRLLMEDGKCNGAAAVTAFNKLVSADGARIVVGGHCTPETLPISAVAEKRRIVMLAAITTTPKLTPAGDYVFRLSSPNTEGGQTLAKYVYKSGLRKLAILREETDYVVPEAEALETMFRSLGGTVTEVLPFNSGEADFRTLLSRVRVGGAEGLYVGIQAPDTGAVISRQMEEAKLKISLFGNAQLGNVLSSAALGSAAAVFEGLTFAEPRFSEDNPRTKTFIERYKARYAGEYPPLGIWTAEAYDAVNVISQMIAQCGEEAEAVKSCLYKLRDYDGAAGRVSIDQNGDGVRQWVIKKITDGKPAEVSPEAK